MYLTLIIILGECGELNEYVLLYSTSQEIWRMW